MNKGIATNILLLLLAGTVAAGLITYMVYSTVETTKKVEKESECINTRRTYCFNWSKFGFNPSSQPTFWDTDCGNRPSADTCKSILGLTSGVTTTPEEETTTISITPTTTVLGLTTTTPIPSDCDSQCKGQGYDSGVCRSSTTSSSEHWGVWQRDTGWGCANNYGLPQIELLESSGLNLVVLNVIKQQWDENALCTGSAATDPPLPYRDHLKFLVDEAKARGIDTVFSYIGWGMGNEDTMNMIRDTTGPSSDPYSREGWITCIEEMVEYCDPYAVLPLEEPVTTTYWKEQTSAERTQMIIDYNDFIIEVIDRVRAIKPNIRVYVMPVPYTQDGMRFWYEDTLARYGTYGLPRSNIVYSTSGYPYYTPTASDWGGLYAAATTQVELDNARQVLYDRLDWKWGDAITNLKMLMVAGVTDYRTLPDQDYNMGATACMVDAFNWAKTYNHELVMFDMRGPNTGNGQYAIQTPDELGWNNLGQLLVDNAPTLDAGGGCLSVETSIGQDGCSSGETCCCFGVVGECISGNDIIKHTDYPTGSCQSPDGYEWSHSTCGDTSVCKEGYCKLVDADLTDYISPSPTNKYARGDTISIPYVIENVGDIDWCFLTETSLTKSDGSQIWPIKYNYVSTGSSTNDYLSYQISCSDPNGTWSGYLYSYTDLEAYGGWRIWGTPSYSFEVVECLNNQDCSNCLGSGYTCDLSTNTCESTITETCDSQCQLEGYDSGVCRESSSEQLFGTFISWYQYKPRNRGGSDWITRDVLEDLASYGCGVLWLTLDRADWNENQVLEATGLRYQDNIAMLVDEGTKLGIRMVVSLFTDNELEDLWGRGSQLLPYDRAVIIMDPVLREGWIQWGVDVINHCKNSIYGTSPWGIYIMDEPGGYYSTVPLTQQYYTDNFVIPSIEAYRAVDPNIAILLMGGGGTSRAQKGNRYLDYYFDNPLRVERGGPYSDIYYIRIGDYRQYSQGEAYATNFESRGHAYARQQLYNSLESAYGPLAPYVIGAVGTRSEDSYWREFMQDLYDWYKANATGYVQWTVTSSSNWSIYNKSGLTTIGQHWADNLAPTTTSSFKDSILFEFGADEDPVGFVPDDQYGGPFDQVGGSSPDGMVNNDRVYVRVTDDIARTGTKSVIEHQPPPTKSDAERRVLCREYSTGTYPETYFSWWVYFPANIDNLLAWRSFGGAQLKYGPSYADRWDYRNGIRFFQSSSGNILVRIDSIYSSMTGAVWGNPSQKGTYREYDSGYDITDLLNSWHHFQVRFLIDQSNGAYQAWIDEDLVYSETGISTDPQSEPEWATGWVWTYAQYFDSVNEPFPYFGPSMYNNVNEPECWYYWDDYVAATQYVPADYRVGEPYGDGGCQPEETSIGQDECSSGQACCCSGVPTEALGYEMSGVNMPSAGGDWTSRFDETPLNVFRDAGGKTIRFHINWYRWMNPNPDPEGNPVSSNYRDYIKQLCDWSREKGLRSVIGLFSSRGWSTDWEQKYAIITNRNYTTGQPASVDPVYMDAFGEERSDPQTDWINWGKEIIAYCNPDGIDMMSEHTSSVDFDEWRDFCIRSITEYRSVKPTIHCYVEGYRSKRSNGNPDIDYTEDNYPGGWPARLDDFMIQPLPFDDITYELHRYWTSTATTSYSLPFSSDYKNGRLAEGRAKLFDYFDWIYKVGDHSDRPVGGRYDVNTLWPNVAVGEYGAYNRDFLPGSTGDNAPTNWDIMMQDFYDWCKSRDIHFIQWAFSSSWPMLTSDETALNSAGQLWADNLP